MRRSVTVAYATLYTRGSDDFVSSVAALIATGWSEPVPGRDFHPLRTSAFHGAPQAGANAVLDKLISITDPRSCRNLIGIMAPPRNTSMIDKRLNSGREETAPRD